MTKRKKNTFDILLTFCFFCAFFWFILFQVLKKKKKPFNNKSGVMLHLRVCMLTYVYTSLIWAELAAFTKTAHTMTTETILCWTGVCVFNTERPEERNWDAFSTHAGYSLVVRRGGHSHLRTCGFW